MSHNLLIGAGSYRVDRVILFRRTFSALALRDIYSFYRPTVLAQRERERERERESIDLLALYRSAGGVKFDP